MAKTLTSKEKKLIDSIVDEYLKEQALVQSFLDQVLSMIRDSSKLEPHLHSIKYRLKDPEHLKDKIKRKILESKEKGKVFNINLSNMFEEINDLAGVRILHLYTAQIENIHPLLLAEFKDKEFELIEKPFARTWDIETKDFFNKLDIQTQDSENMYTSVHYVIGSASRFKCSCEIQVRTLSEELWGEVDHKLNYPHKSSILACREQLKVLARVTSSASRLVDSIFRSEHEYIDLPQANKTKQKQPPKKVKSKKSNR